MFGAIDIAAIAAGANAPETLISNIRIESRWSPRTDLPKPFEGPSKVGPFVRFVRPRISIEVKGFSAPIVLEPGGPLDVQHWPVIKSVGTVVGALILGFAAYGAYRLYRG